MQGCCQSRTPRSFLSNRIQFVLTSSLFITVIQQDYDAFTKCPSCYTNIRESNKVNSSFIKYYTQWPLSFCVCRVRGTKRHKQVSACQWWVYHGFLLTLMLRYYTQLTGGYRRMMIWAGSLNIRSLFFFFINSLTELKIHFHKCLPKGSSNSRTRKTIIKTSLTPIDTTVTTATKTNPTKVQVCFSASNQKKSQCFFFVLEGHHVFMEVICCFAVTSLLEQDMLDIIEIKLTKMTLGMKLKWKNVSYKLGNNSSGTKIDMK